MLTYSGVALALGFTGEGVRSVQADALRPGLRVLDELSRKLRKARMRRGALDLDLPEAHVLLDDKTGAPLDVVRRAKDPGVKRAYQMVEELMLLANELVAQWLCNKGALGIFRVHAAPELEKLERLTALAEKLGMPLDVEQLRDPLGLSRWLMRIAEHPRKIALESLALRSLKQANYDIVNIGHFGLASDAYLHFTSPIRRYPDLVVHRIVKSNLRGAKLDKSPAAVERLRSIATHASVRERASMDVEREVVDLYRAVLMRDHIGEEYEGTVTGVIGTGVFVALDAPFVDVLVRLEGLGSDRYEFAESDLSIIGSQSGESITLGDRMRVRVDDVSILRRQITASRVIVATRGQRTRRAKTDRRTSPGDARERARRDARPSAAKTSRKKKRR
jgi:ribonuclease R